MVTTISASIEVGFRITEVRKPLYSTRARFSSFKTSYSTFTSSGKISASIVIQSSFLARRLASRKSRPGMLKPADPQSTTPVMLQSASTRIFLRWRSPWEKIMTSSVNAEMLTMRSFSKAPRWPPGRAFASASINPWLYSSLDVKGPYCLSPGVARHKWEKKISSHGCFQSAP